MLFVDRIFKVVRYNCAGDVFIFNWIVTRGKAYVDLIQTLFRGI